MKNFNELFDLYSNHGEVYLTTIVGVNFDELYDECDTNLAKYGEFKNWLKYCERWVDEEAVL